MTTDVLRVEANERVDLSDFLFAVDESMRSQSRHWAAEFMRDPARDGPSWVLDDFEITYLGSQLTVSRGRAILGHREEGEVFYGSLTTEGPVERVVDVTTFSNGTYGVYIRFELVEGESGSRAFWNPAGDGSEFAQTISTRRLANWSVRVELTNPGAEWLKIGEATVSGGSITSVTLQRDFFFEGREDQTYESGWSAEGGGFSNDRNDNRATYGAKSLHTFIAATRQCLEDMKGRGLRRWWSKGIGGMNIGFDDDPIEDTLAVGFSDFNLYAELDQNRCWLRFHESQDSFFLYTYSPAPHILELRLDDILISYTTSTYHQLVVPMNITTELAVGYATTTPPTDQVTVGDNAFGLDYSDLNVPKLFFDTGGGAAGWIRYNRTQNELQFGTDDEERLELYDGVLIFERNDYGKICVRDENFALDFVDNALPKLRWNTDDYFVWDRTGDALDLYIGGSSLWRTGTVGTRVRGLAVADGLAIAPGGADLIRIGDINYRLQWDGTDPYIYFDLNDYFLYDRFDNKLIFAFSNVERYAWYNNRGFIYGMTTGDPTTILDNEGQYTYAQQSGVFIMHGPINSGGADVNEVKALHTMLNRANNHTDTDIVGAATVTLLQVTLNQLQVLGKIFRLVVWGTIQRTAGTANNVNFAVTVSDGSTTDFIGAMTFQPTGSSVVHNSRDKWIIEALIPVITEGAAEQIHGQLTGQYRLGLGATVAEIDHQVTAALNLSANPLTIRAYIQNPTVGVTFEYDVCHAFLEEMGGETNAN